ncbi:MAG: twin-arginine translocation signal domain-containing protein [Acidobacteria bacterium]|nr:twin-arginine translocation signal domain-containing protein [Acidobacteriota bacterium]
MESSRRDFLRQCAVAAGSVLALEGRTPRRILIRPVAGDSLKRRLAARELLRGLVALFPASEVRIDDAAAMAGDAVLALAIDASAFHGTEEYSIQAAAGGATLTAAGEQALLYAVFEFLERQGAFFGIDGASYPFDPSPALVLPAAGANWKGTPRFAVRGLLPWPDFLNCITVFNEEDFRAYFESMLRMRFNTFGMHVYTGAAQWAESYLSFEFGGAGHLSYLDTSASNRWGYLPERTSRFTMGGADYYDSEVFGSDSTRLARDPWEQAEKAKRLLRVSFDHAARLGLATGIGFEPYQIPDEIFRALPPEVRSTDAKKIPRFDIESQTAKDLLEARLAQLLEAYPSVDHVWLWEDETMNWESRKSGIPLSVTPFAQAHAFLKRHAPKKRLVLAGWGGVARHFEHFHKALPEDIIFTCLSDTLGWDPVHEVFGKLGGRERWPIPWLEDDPAMWQPQFHVHRFEKDLDRAHRFGCQGMLGIHWRHRIVDPTAGFQARYSWENKPSPADYYQAYARTQAAGERGRRLGRVLEAADRDRSILSTFGGLGKDGHAIERQFSGDYSEAFEFWRNHTPDDAVVQSQKQVVAALRAIAGEVQSPAEKERVEYLTCHVEFLVPYSEAWILAQRLHHVVKAAAELKKGGNADGARAKVLQDGVPLWLKLAPEVRRVMLLYQSIVATRNDQGQLASMHNKLVRLALVRLRLSMKEFLGELPVEVEQLYGQVSKPDPKAVPRIVVPTRPTLFAKGERVRLLIIVPGAESVSGVSLHTRLPGGEWAVHRARLLGRKTYEAVLGPFPATSEMVEYYVTAEADANKLVAPPSAPAAAYTATLV